MGNQQYLECHYYSCVFLVQEKKDELSAPYCIQEMRKIYKAVPGYKNVKILARR